MSYDPTLVTDAPPKFAVPTNRPVTTMQSVPPAPSQFALRSIATACGESVPVPPKRFDHCGVPPAVYFAKNRSPPPASVRGPVPRFAVPVNVPATTTLPMPSTATARPTSEPTPPRACTHDWLSGSAVGAGTLVVVVVATGAIVDVVVGALVLVVVVVEGSASGVASPVVRTRNGCATENCCCRPRAR